MASPLQGQDDSAVSSAPPHNADETVDPSLTEEPTAMPTNTDIQLQGSSLMVIQEQKEKNVERKGKKKRTKQPPKIQREGSMLSRIVRRLSVSAPINVVESGQGNIVNATADNVVKKPEFERGGSTLAKIFGGFSGADADQQKSRSFRQRRRGSGSVFGSALSQERILRRVKSSFDPREGLLEAILVLSRKIQKDEKEAKNRRYEELFCVIDKDKGGTINVSTELGETLIRLGLGIDASVMREAINHVCIRRGRKPDGWFDMNLSTPMYNEIDLDEFQEVMEFLSHDEASQFDDIIKARNVFTVIDSDADGWLSPEELWHVCSGETPPVTSMKSIEDCRNMVLKEFGEKGISFPQFLVFTGCKGSTNQLLEAEIEEIRKELEDCLVTFQTFDLDGSGTIDISETAEVMRAMGQKVTQRELDEIFNLCDPLGSGEIDFESFCTNVLSFSDEKAKRLVEANNQRPIFLETQDTTNGTKLTSIESLLPGFFSNFSNEGENIAKPIYKAVNVENQNNTKDEYVYVWQDFGQYARKDLIKESLTKSELSKVLNRPFTIAMHKSHADVFAAKLSPDGCIAAIGTEAGTLILYDLTRPRPREMNRISAHFHNTMCLDWSPDGTKIVTGGADGVVSMWNAETMVNLACNLSHAGYVRGVTWSPDGLLIASCGSDMSIILWNADQLRPTGTVLNGHSSWIRWCKFTEDSKRLISSGDDHAVLVWDLTEGIVLQTLRGHSRAVVCGSLVPGSDKLFTAGFDGDVLVWTKDTGLLGYLKVFVVEAFNLKRGDTITGNMSNSRFVSVELGKGQRERTAMKKGSSPAWYEEFDFGVWDLEEQVFVQVFDWDKDEAHRFLGSVKVSLDELVYAEEGVTDKEFDLVDDEGEHGKATISLRFTYRAVASIGEVTVFVERARNLPRMDTFGLSDPFCMVSLGKSEKQKTNVVKHNLNPEWNEEFVYNVEEGAREMKLVIYDWNLTLEYDFIGQVIIPVETLMANPFTDSWYPLMSIDGAAPAKGEVKLRINWLSVQERSKKNMRFRRNPTTWPAKSRGDFNFYNPVGQVSFFGRVLLRGKCGFCGKHRIDHENDLRCDLGTGNYVHSIDVSHDGSLVAWGTGDGRIRLALTYSAERIACWTAHAGPVLGLCFSQWDMRLLSWGADHRSLKVTDLVRGAYVPKPQAQRNQSKPSMVVETWFIASLLEDREKWVKKKAFPTRQDKASESRQDGPATGNAEQALNNSSSQLNSTPQETDNVTSDMPGHDAQNSATKDEDEEQSDDDEDDDNKSEREKKKAQDASGKKEAADQEKIRRRLQKGARKLQGRVGYTPVYYDPPLKADGTLARSCLKGRSGKKPLRNGLSFNEVIPKMHNYPPEETSSNEDE